MSLGGLVLFDLYFSVSWFILFLLAIVFPVLLRFTAFDYPFGIFDFSCFQLNNNYVLYVLDWISVVLDHWNNSHVAPLGHIILIPNQPVFTLTV
jgi:hypothetical protein